MKKSKIFFLISVMMLPTFGLSAQSSSKKDTITFIHLTDPHVCNLTGYHPFFIEKRKHFGNNYEPLLQFFKTIPEKYNSDFVAITGDNIDYYESQTEKAGTLDTQIEQYARLLDEATVPVYLTLGNHDIASYFVSTELVYTNNQYQSGRARTVWTRNAACFKDGTYYSRIFKIDTTTFRLIFLDNAYYGTKELKDDALPFLIDQSQLLWLNDQLRISNSDVELIFMHMPVSYRKGTGKNIVTEPLSIYSSKSKTYNLLRILENNSSAPLFFVGHNHDNVINSYLMGNGKKITQVMTGCFGADHVSWRVIKLTGDNIIICAPGGSRPEHVIPIR